MSGGAAAGAAVAAAAAARALREEEEEEMTPYRDEDLAEGWEFKFLRSSLGAFKKPERLREILAEEARAGWVLVEKFDNGRIRLKRPAHHRERDAGPGLDPYRSEVPGERRRVLLYAAWVVAAILALVGVVALTRS